MNFPIVNANGTTRWVEQSFTKLYDNEMFVGYLGIARDVTERQEIQEYLEELLSLHSLVLENISSAVISCDLHGIISVFNNAAEYMLGYTADEVIGEKNITDFFTLDDLYEKKKTLLQSFGKEIAGDLETFFLTAEHFGNYIQRSTFREKHGGTVSADMRIRLLKDSAGAATGLLFTAQDVSDVQHLEQIKQDFISRVSHEMRTPLHGIMGMIEILRYSELNAEQRSILEIAQSKSDVLLTLINDILEYSKIQSGALEIQNTNADLSILMNNISEVLQYRLFAKGTELHIQFAPHTPQMLYCDPVRLYQIVLNLCENLMQFTEGGTLHIDIEFLEKYAGNSGLSLSLYILNGTVRQDVQRKVFAPFMDEHSNKEIFHPAGLQITLLRGIVQKMGGLLWLEQDLEKKSVFHIFLAIDDGSELQNEAEMSFSPSSSIQKDSSREEREEDALPKTAHAINVHDDSASNVSSAIQSSTFPENAQKNVVENKHPRKNIRILVVDDDQDNRNLAETFLSHSSNPSLSYHLSFAENGERAVQCFEEQRVAQIPFDLVLMDIQMPVMDGFEATKVIREQEKIHNNPRVPIIAITAHVMEHYREKCLAIGMNDYLAKPVKKKQLNDMIEKWLEQRTNILLVDDSEDFRLVLQLQLEKEQCYHLLLASNGQEAIELFQEHDVDAVIMDMEMPIINGYEATRILRQMPKGRTIPIFAMTGHNGEKEIQRTLDVGCTKCYTKEGLETIRTVAADLRAYFAAQENVVSTQKGGNKK
ncbi:MAG: response regulator [Candidatus Kapaibacterium sp.]|nr:MAG: response regulator [Candidatus Kapabacteria bacterium]